MKKICICIAAVLFSLHVSATNYYVNNALGNDQNDGRSFKTAFQTMAPLKAIAFAAGDSIIFKGNQRYEGSLILESVSGTADKPIVVTTHGQIKATIDGKGLPYAILVKNSSHVVINRLHVTANAGGFPEGVTAADGRFGILITADKKGVYSDISVRKVDVDSVYYENAGHIRTREETRDERSTGKYGWGIRIKYVGANENGAQLDHINIEDCTVTAVSHTGIRFTGVKDYKISNVRVTGNKVTFVGGPGIQGGYIRDAYFGYNTIDHSGSDADSRNWKRGSCLWTGSADNVLTEYNSFTNANGPMDSAGAHIDFNCTNVVLQYNFSANNIGSFVEILGNDRNCAYRYNISVNDGWRSGEALNSGQQGKTLWFSGYIGGTTNRSGPFNCYVYNNTIYVKSEIQAKMAIENTSSGVLIANNILCIESNAITVLGDQYNPEKNDGSVVHNVVIKNNLFLHKGSWPADNIQDVQPLFGDPGFANKGGLEFKDYIPANKDLVRNGIDIEPLPGDNIGLVIGLKVDRDILGNPIKGKPSIGAIQVE